MSVFKTYEIDIDTMKETQSTNILFNQGDLNTAKLIIRVLHNGETLNLSGYAVRIALMKVDGKRVYQDCEIVDAQNGLVEVILTTQSLAAAGKVEGELSLSFGGNKKMISTKFSFQVEKSIMNSSAVESMNDLSVIERALHLVESLGQVNLDNLVDVSETIEGFSSDLDKVKSASDGKVYIKDFMIMGESSHEGAFQRASDYIRGRALTSNFDDIPYLVVPGGRYTLRNQVKMSPTVKMKSEGFVNFFVDHDGTGIWICQEEDDVRIESQWKDYHLGKNSWNRGEYFDGSNGAFVFTTSLRRNNAAKTVALEIGLREEPSWLQKDYFPISRYVVSNVNIYGFHTGLKLNACDHYLGNFKNMHIEGNCHAIHFNKVTDINVNAGENVTFESCIIANSNSNAVLINAPAIDVTFENTSFDFNNKATFKMTALGSSVRAISCYFEDNENKGPIFECVASQEGVSSWNGRCSFYISNCIALLREPIPIIMNTPYEDTNEYVILHTVIDGLEVRYGNTRQNYSNLDNRFLIKGENINLYKKALIKGSLISSHLSREMNLLSNGDFSKSVAGSQLSDASSDLYWVCSQKTNISEPTILEHEGADANKCLRYDIANTTTNSMTLRSKINFPCEPSDIFYLSAIFKTDIATNNSPVIYAIDCFDANDVSTGEVLSYDTLTPSTSPVNLDITQFQLTRGVGILRVPAGTVKIRPRISLNNFRGAFVCLDDIVFTKAF